MEVKILNNSMTISISINGSCTVTSVRHRMNALKSDIDSTIKQLKRINNGLSNINGPVNGNISSAINGINSRIRSEEEKREAIVEIDEKIDAFVEHALATDRSVARNIHQNEKRFYKEYPWLKPDIIPQKNVWQNMLEGGKALLKKIGNGLKEIWKGVKEFVKEHALEIIIGTIGIIVAVVLTVLTGGTIWSAILVVFKSVVISMAVSAALSTGIALITGGDVKKAFLDGLASGYMWGGIFASISSGVQFVKAIKSTDLNFAEMRKAYKLANKYKLDENQYINHILDEHGPSSTWPNKSKFLNNFNIKKGIKITMKNGKSIIKLNTRNRPGYYLEYVFKKPIGVSQSGQLLYKIKVVLTPDGFIKTAFPR